jgi:DNA-binding IclR family transcriptional regulator
VELGSSTCDAVAVALGMPPQEAAVCLARLELLGYLRVDWSGSYTRSSLVPPSEVGAK